ncbi:general substrate transporter [Collybia nuda]|uniref:General substrate transporter n=1 Tax=Collybia nuda TaxID=64659 RepID=A0A9P5YDM7_9AGAR|nr:general substrate transporter [Collybia nuda]
MSPPEWTIIDFIHTGPWWRNRGILVLNLWLLLPLLSSSVNGLNSSLVNGLQIIPAWQEYFNHPSGKTLGLINAAQNIGCLVGLPISPFLSDGLGRRPTLFLGSLIMLAGIAIQTAATSVQIFVAARIIMGIGLEFCSNSAPLLLIELSYPTQRGKITSMYNSSWYLGSIISAWVCFGAYERAEHSLWSFRAPTLVQAMIPFAQVVLIWFIPESPRFLVSKGFEGRAANILAKYHANGGDERDPLVVFEIAQIRHAIRMEEEINTSTSFRSLFATPGNRKRMRLIIAIGLFSQWSGNGLVSYYINLVLEGVGVTKTETKAIINGSLQCFNFVIAIGAAMLVDWVGRRKLFIISNAGMLVSFGSWTVTIALYNNFDNLAAAKATIPLIFIFYFFYDIAYTPMLVAYTLEILPYRIRAKGFALMNLTVMLTVAFNQFINPVAIDAIGWWYYLVYCAWLIVELVFVVIFIVETKGRTLEETSAMFDGDEQPHDLIAMGGDAATMSMSRRNVVELDHKYSQKEELELQELHSRPDSDLMPRAL